MRYPMWRGMVFAFAALFPMVWLYQGLMHLTGPDPGKVLVDNLGQGALVLLLLALSMTPMQKATGWSGWVAMRRQLGLWCFAYVVLHISGYLLFLLGLRWDRLLADLVERPYIIVGVLGFMGLVPLALTSNRWSQRRLGVRWKKLHRLVYPILVLALLHMLWVVRSDAAEWAVYAASGALLMLLRVPFAAEQLVGLRMKMTKTFQKRVDGRF